MSASVTAYVGTGSNVGDRLAHLRAAVAALRAEVRIAALSAVYEAEAHVLPGQPPQPDHLNAVVALDTDLDPRAVLALCHTIERAAGRDARAPRWSPRPLDLDVLLYGDRVVTEARLVVPHPRLAERRFALAPLADVAPHLVVPGLNRTVAELLANCPDRTRIVKTDLRLPSG